MKRKAEVALGMSQLFPSPPLQGQLVSGLLWMPSVSRTKTSPSPQQLHNGSAVSELLLAGSRCLRGRVWTNLGPGQGLP